MFYFAGWYLSTDSSTIITSLPSTIDDDITLCAKWIKKAQLKIELPVFENGNRTGNTTIYDTHKYFYNQTTDPIGIKNLLTYIGAGYTVPENYKFIGFNASSGFTATQDYSDMNNITTRIEVGATSDVLTITADIRKILTVTLTMDAKHTYLWQTEYFKITQVIISSNSMYSTDKSNWLMSNGSGSISAGDRNGSATQKITFYLIEGTNANITVIVDSVTISLIKFDPPTPQVNNCTTSDKKSPFKFIIGDNDASISWT